MNTIDELTIGTLQDTLTAIIKTRKQNLPKGFKEGITMNICCMPKLKITQILKILNYF